jgi:hypothetical protein
MPFILNDLIRDVNPVKVYEYLSMGKPVIMPYYNEVLEFNEFVYMYKDDSEFIEYIEKALLEDGSRKNMRIAYAEENSWNKRRDYMETIIQRSPERRKINET